METLFKKWHSTFYAWPVTFFVTLFFVILFFIPNKRSRNIPLLIKLYLLAYLITFIIIDAAVIIRNQSDYFAIAIRHYTDYVFTIIEFILITYYFYIHNNKPKQKKALIYLIAIFLLPAFILSFQLPNGLAVVRLYTIQVFLLLIPSFFYFKELFRDPAVDIANSPTFWISTGITFFLLCTMIFSIIEAFLLNNKPHILAKLYPLYYVFYMLMFSLFFKAYLCKPVISKS